MAAAFAVLVNASAGSPEEDALTAAERVLAGSGPVRRMASEDPDDLDALLGGLGGGETLVVAGGDGSLHLVLDHLHRSGRLAATPIGLVPLGTGNDLARGQGLPLDPAEAAARIVAGSAQPRDLLVDDAGGIVANAVHAGLGAEAAERAAGLKPRLGPLAYPVGALVEGVRASGWDLVIEVDGEPLDLPGESVLLAGVGNGPYVGGGTPMFPGAAADDGALDVLVSCATGPAARAAFGLALRTGEHVEREDVVTKRGTSVRISGEPVGLDTDGELEDEITDRTWRLEPGAWSLVC